MFSNSSHTCIGIEELTTFMETCCPHPVFLLDPDQNLIFCNSAFQELTGLSLEDLAGKPVNDTIGFHHSLSCKHIESKIFVKGLDSENGKKECRFIHMYDVQPGADSSLLQEFAGKLMKDMNLGVILFDANFQLVDISDMACRVLGLNRAGVLNQPMNRVFGSLPEEHHLVARSIFDGVVVRNHAVSWMNNQDRYELLLDSNILKNNKGEVAGGYVMFKDVTNLRSLEEQVQRSDRLAMIGQIAAGTAHEIRNPLTSVKGFMQIIRNTFIQKGMDKEQGYTDIILSEIDRINDLVSEFLLLSKRKNVTYVKVDIPHVMKEILPIIHNEALLNGISVNYEPAKDLPAIVADREMLKQVFLNISKNGIEAMGEGGTLTISEKVDPDEEKVHVDIHDTGPGIPNFVIDKIFDPFFTTKASGTGLGLSVCQRIIHDMGGTIRVSAKGFGTTFTVSIPVP